MNPLDLGLLAIRLAVGLTFFAHGAQKAFGWWGGAGLGKWSAAMTRMGLRPAPFWAVVSVAAEVVCGPLLALGLLTPVASSLLVAQGLYIVFRSHLPKGFWNRNGGIEFPLQLLAGSLLVATSGPGALSIDALLGVSFAPEARLAIFVVAVAGALVAFAMPRPPAAAPTSGARAA